MNRSPAPPSRASAPALLAVLPVLRALLPAVLLAAVLGPGAAPASAQDNPQAYLDPTAEQVRKRNFLFSGGLEFPISGSQGIQPQVAAYLDLPRSLQIGIKARVDLRSATDTVPFDYIPQTGLHLRQLWLSDQDTSTVRNSEYISLVLGFYPAYDFEGSRDGLKPFGAIALGKYWMPFGNRPYGLDFCIEISRFFDGHPPGRPRTFFLSAGVNLFRAIPLH
jgi:hypothetical protein